MRSKKGDLQLRDKVLAFILDWAGDPERIASRCVTAWRIWRLYNEAAGFTVYRGPSESSLGSFNKDFEWIRNHLAETGNIELVKVSQKLFEDFKRDGTEIPGSDSFYTDVRRFGVESKVKLGDVYLKDDDGNFQTEIRSPHVNAEAYFKSVLPCRSNPARGIAIVPPGVLDHGILIACHRRASKGLTTRTINFKERINRDVEAEQITQRTSVPLLSHTAT